MAKELHVTVLHGSIKAARSGPSYNANTHKFINMVSSYLEEASAKGMLPHLLVSNAYPITGNIPAYVRNPERAKARVRFRATTLNPKTMSQNNPIRMLRRLAASYGVNILYGPVYEVAGPRNYVTTVMIKPDGSLEKYRKVMLTPAEEELGLTRGKTPGIFDVVDVGGRPIGRIGVFIDEDLFSPVLFEAFYINKVHLVIGHMMPYRSRFLPPPQKEGPIVTMKHCFIDKILTARSIDAGAPLVLVGGVLNIYTSGRKLHERHWMPTTVLDPEDPENDICLTMSTARTSSRPFMTVEDVDKFKRIVVDVSESPQKREQDCTETAKWFKKMCMKK
ncbi:MAG: carbon-nitrogen hydrolase family protein [Desulfurococcales archaeon]|nr:carbon-nitrogen hydrolase family protein [Desulfurococcales archaeon]MCE4622370.1 carbon-nitrogen hydrolase family protein [Desulfurococcales archaeon]MCE4626810.1 carbon-nitrogen hydrolase family protein [Desulfurococcales archaeon]MCE4629425.1 carbon-nitrogen hydrolase family protein [Desulfurococcales archaeon]